MTETEHAIRQGARILILDDEAEIRTLLQRYLTDQGMVVRAVMEAREMERLLQRERFDVLVLDLMLPGEDGLSICRRLRSAGETIPILMLTARGEPVDRIVGLEMGADDYLAKPFNPRELVARIGAIQRRREMDASGVAPHKSDVVSFGEFTLNLARQELLQGEVPITLSSTEYALLAVLASNRGRALGRDRLIELAKGRNVELQDRTIDVQILRLRRLIEADPAKPVHIKTVWGVGYTLAAG